MSTDTIGKVREISESAVVITGGTSGIGLAAAILFAEHGCKRIALIGRSRDRGAQAKSTVEAVKPDVQVEFIAADAHDPVQAQAAVDQAYAALGGIDVLINSVAAEYFPKLLFKTDMD